jgi:hypothetical protein
MTIGESPEQSKKMYKSLANFEVGPWVISAAAPAAAKAAYESVMEFLWLVEPYYFYRQAVRNGIRCLFEGRLS